MGMKGILAAAALAAAPASPAPAQAPAPSECRMLGKLGCYYLPSSLDGQRKARVLVYLRGHHPVLGGVVPDESREESARRAFAGFQLGNIAQAEKVALFVTASSHLAVSPKDLKNAADALGMVFDGVILAAHSGGYAGLSASLPSFEQVDQIVMLDNFYFGADLTRLIKAKLDAGAACAGFYTSFKYGKDKKGNKVRYEENFKPLIGPAVCPVERHDDYGHNDGVNRCLGPYLRRRPCP